MDPQIDRALSEQGFAPVLAVLDDGDREAGADSLRHFLDEVPELAGGRAKALCRRPSKYRKRGARHFWRLGVTLGYVDRDCIQRLGETSRVRTLHHGKALSVIEPVATRAVHHAARTSWGLQRLQVSRLRAQSLDGSGIRIGHLDSGVDGTHPALRSRIVEFAEFDDMGRQLPSRPAFDSGDHGTHTAGILCGEPVDGRAIGVAPGAELISGLVARGTRAEQLTVLAGLEWLLTQNVRVICLSVGFEGLDLVFENVVRRLKRRGALPVFAIGNDGIGTSSSPANYPESLSVGAMDRTNRIADFSSSETLSRPIEPQQPNVVAPGVSIISAKAGGGLVNMKGTSMAAPFVAGVAALMFQAEPSVTPDEVEQALQDTAIRLPGENPARFGHGLINPPAAVAALTA